MRIRQRHLHASLLGAVLIHAGALLAVLPEPEAKGARAAGQGGIEVSLGPAGGAPGAAAVADGDVSTAETAPPPSSVEVVQAPVEQVAPETARPKEAVADAPPTRVETQVAPAEAAKPEAARPERVPVEPAPIAVAAIEPPPPVAVETIRAPIPPPVPAEVVRPAPPPPPPAAVVETVEVMAPPLPVARPERPKPAEAAAKPTPQPAQQVAAVAERATTRPSEAPPSDAPAANASAAAGSEGRSGQGSASAAGTSSASSSGGAPGVSVDYVSILQAWLEDHKEYPSRARSRRQQGVVWLYFVMDRGGHVLTYRIDRSSGHSLLDHEVKQMIERAQPLPAMPAEMTQSRLELVVPVQFMLR